MDVTEAALKHATQQLTSMGFDENLAQFALSVSGNELPSALDWIQEHSQQPPSSDARKITDPDLPLYSSELNAELGGESHEEERKEGTDPSANMQEAVPFTLERLSVAEKPKTGLGRFLTGIGVAAPTVKIDEYELRQWGLPGSTVHNIVMRYWKVTRMTEHWMELRSWNAQGYLDLLRRGYCEPIPTQWVTSRKLAYPYPESSLYESSGEERLYYVLNNMRLPNGSRSPRIQPLNVSRNPYGVIARGNARNALARRYDPNILELYRSPHDVFLQASGLPLEYSAQVPTQTYAMRTLALHELAEGLAHGTDHLETMILMDVSGSMLWDPRNGVIGPDGIRRFHNQPANLELVRHLMHRCLNHMVPRAQREHAKQYGIPTVTFSSRATFVGQMSASQFDHDWHNKIRPNLGGGTQVMMGWQKVKNTYFEQVHKATGHGFFHNIFGWQPTPGMPKLSLLVFLDGEAMDMDEFELELMGESWAFVTICLVGYENCPHHHSHAMELERVARYNPHVGFYDVQGRALERYAVEQVLKSVYPVDPPTYQEIVDPRFEIYN